MRRKMRRKRKFLTGRQDGDLADPVCDHVSGTKTPQGILAVVERRDYRMPDILGAEAAKALVLVLETAGPGQPRDHFPHARRRQG